MVVIILLTTVPCAASDSDTPTDGTVKGPYNTPGYYIVEFPPDSPLPAIHDEFKVFRGDDWLGWAKVYAIHQADHTVLVTFRKRITVEGGLLSGDVAKFEAHERAATTSGAPRQPSASSECLATLKAFLQACDQGNESEATRLCDYEIGNGSSVVPAALQVHRFIGFLRSRTIAVERVDPSGDYTQFVFGIKETPGRVIINLRPFKGGQWLVTAVNIED